MSQEDARLVSEIYAAINRGDFEAVAARMTADVAYVNPPYAVEPGTRTGPAGFSAAMTNLRETFPGFAYSIEAVEQHGDHVLVTAMLRNLGEEGEMSWPRHHVWTLRDGRVCTFRWFSTRSEAIEASKPTTEIA